MCWSLAIYLVKDSVTRGASHYHPDFIKRNDFPRDAAAFADAVEKSIRRIVALMDVGVNRTVLI